MKILLANQALGYGGITSYAIELIKCLSQDNELTVVLPDDSVNPIRAPRVKVLYYDTMELSVKNAQFFIGLINEELKPDLVISSQGLIIPIIVPFLNNDTRVMTVSHSGRLFSSEYSTLNHKYTDVIIAASSYFNKRYLEKKYHIKDKSKIKLIYNFMSHAPALEELRFEKKKSKNIKIIYAGGPLPGKNPDLVLKILCKLLKTDLNFKFYWTGGTQLPLPPKLSPCIKPNDVRQYLNEDDRVVFTGRISSEEEFDRLVSSCNILITPSRNEGCSMLLLQALRSGSICVVGDYPHGNREIVERGDCGFVLDHHSPDAFVDKLKEIIKAPADYAQLYENAYRFYNENLTYSVWKRSLDELMKLPPNHSKRMPVINCYRLKFDIYRMNAMKRADRYKRLFGFALKSLFNFYMQFFRMRLRGDYPLKSEYCKKITEE